MDRIFIETVGVGQAELDVLTCADLIVLVLQPGTGDVIQALKAGIIEAADLLLVNKSDLPGTEIAPGLAALPLRDRRAARRMRRLPPVFTTVGPPRPGTGRGLRRDGASSSSSTPASGRFRDKQRQRLEAELRATLQQDLWERFSALTNAPEELRTAAEALLENNRSPYPFLRAIGARVRMEIEDERT